MKKKKSTFIDSELVKELPRFIYEQNNCCKDFNL